MGAYAWGLCSQVTPSLLGWVVYMEGARMRSAWAAAAVGVVFMVAGCSGDDPQVAEAAEQHPRVRLQTPDRPESGQTDHDKKEED